MKIKEFWLRMKAALRLGMHRFLLWFQLNVKPDLVDFLEDNRELAMRVVLEVARDMAESAGSIKRMEAAHRIAQHLLSALPEVEAHSSWINLLIEIAVQVLKAQGKL